MTIFLFILLAIFILMVMITIHELGHYLVGKWLGFRINEFSIGFGKAIFKRQSKKTGEIFAIRMIPLGGYCMFSGEDNSGGAGTGFGAEPSQEEFPNRKGQYFDKQPPWKRLCVLFSGGFFNFIFAILFCFILIMSVGYHQEVRVHAVRPEADGIYAGDRITAINGERFRILNGWNVVINQYNVGDEITLTLYRAGQRMYVPVEIQEFTVDGRQVAGIGFARASAERIAPGFWEAIGQSFMLTFRLAWLMLVILWHLITGRLSLNDAGGPIATISVMASVSANNLMDILILLPLISVNLAVFNLLPIPALDGAKMVFVGIEWIRGKPVNPEIEGRIHIIGLVILLGLVLLLDINFLFNSLGNVGRAIIGMTGRFRL